MLINNAQCMIQYKSIYSKLRITRTVITQVTAVSSITAVSLLTESEWRLLPQDRVLGKTGNCTCCVRLAQRHPKSSLATKESSTLNPLHGSTAAAAVLGRVVRCMKAAGQSPRDPVSRLEDNHEVTQVGVLACAVRAVRRCPPNVCLLSQTRGDRHG